MKRASAITVQFWCCIGKLICNSACAGLGRLHRVFSSCGERVVNAFKHIVAFAGRANVQRFLVETSSRHWLHSAPHGFFTVNS